MKQPDDRGRLQDMLESAEEAAALSQGKTRADMDLDLLVIELEVGDRGAQIVRLRRPVGDIGKGVDIFVYSASEVEQRKDWCTSALYWALREGRVVYDSAVQ